MTAVLGRTIVRPIEALSRATRLLAEGRKAEPPQPTLRVREIDGLIHDLPPWPPRSSIVRITCVISRLLWHMNSRRR
jgi:hypothetical protein